ncbi:MAG: rRNA pseudouridine synthase [Myxococcota bacterium]|nr:rRNA pseudouridine synthase [Myxococcota bacterium]
MARERLQKILAHAGIASRRAAEGLIAAGNVRVNGVIVSELGASADPRKDKIEVDGKRIVLEKPVYYVLHKPRGMVSTLSDPEGRPHLGEVLRRMESRVYPVGRLDFHTSGVLLVTNDGELTEALLHPRKDVPKIYVAKLRGFVTVDDLDKLRNGVVLDDGVKTKKAEVFVLREEERNTWVQITLHEGKNRQIHRMGEAIGHPVLRLARVSFAGITAEGLRPGDWRELDARELEKLKKNYITSLRRSKDLEAEQAAKTKTKTSPRAPAKTTAKAGPRAASQAASKAPAKGRRGTSLTSRKPPL